MSMSETAQCLVGGRRLYRLLDGDFKTCRRPSEVVQMRANAGMGENTQNSKVGVGGYAKRQDLEGCLHQTGAGQEEGLTFE